MTKTKTKQDKPAERKEAFEPDGALTKKAGRRETKAKILKWLKGGPRDQAAKFRRLAEAKGWKKFAAALSKAWPGKKEGMTMLQNSMHCIDIVRSWTEGPGWQQAGGPAPAPAPGGFSRAVDANLGGESERARRAKAAAVFSA